MEHPKQEFGALWLLFCFFLHLALLAKDTLTHLRFPSKPGWLQTHNQTQTRVRGFRNQSHPANYENLILFWQVMLQKVHEFICAMFDTHISYKQIYFCVLIRSLLYRCFKAKSSHSVHFVYSPESALKQHNLHIFFYSLHFAEKTSHSAAALLTLRLWMPLA